MHQEILTDFFEDWPTEDSLLSPIMNSINHNRFEYGSVKFLFCDNKEEQDFWVHNIGTYIHLYVFSILTEWSHQYDSITEERRRNFLSFFKEAILSEIYSFVSQINITPRRIHSAIGIIIDSYLWEEKMEAPYLSTISSMPQMLTNDTYQCYCHLFENFINTKSVVFLDENVCNLLHFCSETDLVVDKRDCFLLLLKRFSGINTNNDGLSKILQSLSVGRCSFNSYKEIICFYFTNYNNYKDHSFISFCNKPNEIYFWREYLSSYSFAFLYFILQEWLHENSNSIELNHWLGIITNGEAANKMEEEMKSFKTIIVNKCQSNSQAIVDNIGFMIEEYFWIKKNEVPSLLNSIAFSSHTVDKYQKLLLDSVKNKRENFFSRIENYLLFCYILDSNATFKRNSLLEVLELTSDNESEKLDTILELFPYYGDDFGLSLLQFCNDNQKLYKLSKQTILKYKFHLFVDSWRFEISKRLGENGRPYSVELCEKTASHKKIVAYLNHRHPIFWNKCDQMSRSVIEKIRYENLDLKRTPVEDRVSSRAEELSRKEKKLIFQKIEANPKEALKEAIWAFLMETKQLAESNGKKINLTEDVSKVLYNFLIEKYTNFDTPEFPYETEAAFDKYGDKVARVWIRRYLIGDDEVSTRDQISSDKFTSIEKTFNEFVWDRIIGDIFEWCKKIYSYNVPNSYTPSFDDDNSSDYDHDDYGIYGGGAFM